jgi:mRNA-degrading endonuclease RelE of RelBE toxin-antitoxin system
MSYDIRYSDTFKREAKALAKKYPSIKQDLAGLVKQLSEKPDIGTPLGNNMFKIRMSVTSKGRGKSGGARVITCVVYKSEQVLLAEIYDKGDYATVDERKILKNLEAEGFDL